MTPTMRSLCQTLLDQHETDTRILVAIAGAPGSGKSTFTEALHQALGGDSGVSVVVPMDGFHLDNDILDQHGWRHIKGAPRTFDVAGFQRTLETIQSDSGDVYVPLFDRAADLARAAARCVTREHRIILVEGNYLLFDQPPWSHLGDVFDVSVYLDVPLAVLEQRLMQRWLDSGLDEQTATVRVQRNDLPNARDVMSFKRPADWVMSAS